VEEEILTGASAEEAEILAAVGHRGIGNGI
jgi:hypothetical protein